MPKYLFQATYEPAGIRALMKEGATARVAAAKKLIASAGGKMECFYFTFGSNDIIAITDLPDNGAAAALSATVAASGVVRGTIVPLLTAEEVDKGFAKKIVYRAPGE